MPTTSKFVAVVIAVLCIVLAFAREGHLSASVGKLVIVLLLPLALIWFPDELGSFTGYIGRGGRIGTETPPLLVSFLGWLMLLGIPLLAYWSG